MSAAFDEPGFDALLDYLRRSRGFDFNHYKHSSLIRRIQQRMQTVHIERFGDYTEFLEVHPDEFIQLFNTILINVTSFFRDPPAWEFLATEIIPALLKNKGPADPIRVWSAGCASGEEAYSLAMFFAEALGLDAFRDRIKIYGTDVDEDALKQARLAVYTAKQVADIPAPLCERYFESANDRFSFRKDLRRGVIFGRLDLLSDAPISRLDLLACRNTLMYFNAEAQARILERFHFALNEGSYLFLGKAEMLVSSHQLFGAVDLKRHMFAKLPRGNGRERTLWAPVRESAGNGPDRGRLADGAFENAPFPQMVVDDKGAVVLINAQLRALFHLSFADLGKPLQDLEVSYRPVDLRSLIQQAVAEGRPAVLREVEWSHDGAAKTYLDVRAFPLQGPAGTQLGIGIAFADRTNQHRIQADLQRVSREREAAHEELQTTNEELETTNEELQSTNEELETTNEELQSTNEELETMNEELQSANEELQTINEELHQSGDELNRVNGFLEAIMTSLRSAAVVLDADLVIRFWNHRAEDFWGLRTEEVRGKHFFSLDIGLPVEKLKQPIRTCMACETDHQEDLVLDAINRRGKSIQCKINLTPLAGTDGKGCGVILLMEDALRNA